MERSEKFWNPYLAGIALGLVLLSAFLVMGHGLGASGAANRLATSVTNVFAPGIVSGNASMSSLSANGRGILDDWLVFELLGVVLGGLFAAYTAGRLKLGIVKGPRISVPWRLVAALSGGVLMGLAARAARGCTSGQALSGGAVMSAGSWVFMMAVFGGGYAFAWFVRRQWT
jgi:uncharacterized membrane protein YedE/YeeE